MKWAIIGTGDISRQFARDSSVVDNVEIVAVCSRTKINGEAFAGEFNIKSVYTDYNEMLDCEDVDNIYVGTPHPSHKEVVNTFLKGGKNVLCEKPLGVNKGETLSMIETARENNCLLMEAMWTLFFPAVIKAKELIDKRHFGKVNSIAGFAGFGSGGSHDQWRYKNSSAGGALLDLGIYPIHLYLHIFDKVPMKYDGIANVENGVDMTDKVIMDFDGTLTSFDVSIANTFSWTYDIYCEKGSIHLDRFVNPSKLTLKPFDGEIEIIDFSYELKGMQYEIEAFDDAAKRGDKELAPLTYDRTIKAIEIMDALRKKWNLRYPSDD